jgi:hypothetical protein
MFLLTAKIISPINTKYFHTQNESGGPALTVELRGMNSKKIPIEWKVGSKV